MVEVIVNFFPPNIHTLRNEDFMYGFFFVIVHCSLHFFFMYAFGIPFFILAFLHLASRKGSRDFFVF